MGCAGSTGADPGSVSRQPSRRKSFHRQHTITGTLGIGGASKVYAVRRGKEEGRMAVKVTDLRVSSDLSCREIDIKKKLRVEREAKILRMLRNSPHVVHIVDDYMEGVLSYILMEACDMTLFQVLSCAPVLTERTVQHALCKMLQALVAVHEAGIIHRDVKPENFLCTLEGTMKLCDFGFAEVMPASQCLNRICGTVPFMSPEMIADEGYGLETDVWSLGVIAYVLLFGEFPYQPVVSTAESMKSAIAAGLVLPSFRPRDGLGIGNGTISASAARSVEALLDRNPRTRPSAKSAGTLPWFERAAPEQRRLDSLSLKPMLYSARRLGAFGFLPRPGSGKMSFIDTTVSALQAEFRGTCMQSTKFSAAYAASEDSSI